MTENAPALIEELDRRRAAMSPGDGDAERRFWEAATRLGMWYVVNRGTPEDPQPGGFRFEGIGSLLGVYSTTERAGAAAGPGGSFLGLPMPGALEWLESFADRGVSGIVMDHPGPWIPLANLGYLRRWVPEAQSVVTTQTLVAAPAAQRAMDAYAADQDDERYAAVVRELAEEDLFVVLDPAGDGTTPTHIVNDRGERVLLAFTDSARVDGVYGGKQVEVARRAGRDLLAQVGEAYDVVVVDAQHPASFAATPESIRPVLGGGAPAGASDAPKKGRGRFGRR